MTCETIRFVRIWIVLALAVVACRRDRPVKPTPPPAVQILRLSPVIGERFTYDISQELKLVLTDGTTTLAATEKLDAQAEEIVTAVQNSVVMEREIRFTRFVHQPLGSEKPLDDVVTGKTYRWTGTPSSELSGPERAALQAYARRDTGEPDLVAHLLTNREFERGVPWNIPPDQPAPFARGLHAGASITLFEIDRSLAVFTITQVMVLELRGERVPITLHGHVMMDIGTARIAQIAVEGHITERTGPVQEAHMTSVQTFTYAR